MRHAVVRVLFRPKSFVSIKNKKNVTEQILYSRRRAYDEGVDGLLMEVDGSAGLSIISQYVGTVDLFSVRALHEGWCMCVKAG